MSLKDWKKTINIAKENIKKGILQSLIGYKNPDFIDEENKIVIEVYYDYYKIRDFGSCEEYEKQRSEYFAKYGWKTIFIRTKDISAKNWKEICLNKILNVKINEESLS